MPLSTETLILLCIGFFLVATLYSSVGLGGGSSYLALLTLFLGSFFAIRSIALICNLVVVSGSTYLYFRDGHAKLKDFLPFVLASIPLAFIGASFRLQEHIFFILLGFSLVISSIFLVLQTVSVKNNSESLKLYPKHVGYILGGGIGLLSGLVGIGGGIFLAPVLNHLRWGRSIKIAALASFFILVNSVSGLAGLVSGEMLEIPWKETSALVISVFIGGQLGIRLSLKRLTPKGIKRVTALLVFVVGIRILAKYLPELI